MEKEHVLRDEQAGFRQKRSTTDQIATLRNIIQQSLEWNTTLYTIFVDFKKVFDSVPPPDPWSAVVRQAEKWRAVEKHISGGNRATDQEMQVVLACWAHAEETSRPRHTKSATVDTSREAQTRKAEDHLAAFNWSWSEGRWPDVGRDRAEGPGQGGMTNSGGRPMFRKERQELSQVKSNPLISLPLE